jgi:hypothetical protein
MITAWCRFLKVNEGKTPRVNLNGTASASGGEEDEAVGGEREGIDCRARLAIFVESAMKTVFAGSFGGGGSFKEADCGVVEADYNEVFFGADGDTAAPGGGGHAVFNGGYGGLDEVYDTQLDNGEHLR